MYIYWTKYWLMNRMWTVWSSKNELRFFFTGIKIIVQVILPLYLLFNFWFQFILFITFLSQIIFLHLLYFSLLVFLSSSFHFFLSFSSYFIFLFFLFSSSFLLFFLFSFCFLFPCIELAGLNLMYILKQYTLYIILKWNQCLSNKL